MKSRKLPYLKYVNGWVLVVMFADGEGVELALTSHQARQFYQQLLGVSHG